MNPVEVENFALSTHPVGSESVSIVIHQMTVGVVRNVIARRVSASHCNRATFVTAVSSQQGTSSTMMVIGKNSEELCRAGMAQQSHILLFIKYWRFRINQSIPFYNLLAHH